jgi:hypothetical protein
MATHKDKHDEPEKKAKTVKVQAIYTGFSQQRASLWGVDFVWEGEPKKGAYFAELDKDSAEQMMEAGRVKAA